MKNNRFARAKAKMKDFFIRLKHKDTSFLIIALCIMLLATAVVWRYTSNPENGQSDLAENDAPNGDVQVHEDPYEDYVQDIIDDFQNAENDNDEDDEDDDGVKSEQMELKSMKVPLAGELIREFTIDDLVYYEAIGEWRVHKGIDIKPKDTLLIESALAGKVEAVNNSEITATEIIIDHGNNVKTLYSNLVSANVKAGDTVEKGQVIGNLGKTVSIEASDGAHLHFEVIVDGQQINPLDYIAIE
ncbi:MAG: M23 family metallopeptidase [Tissierellia bacterium]|jgi:murein DD-endopeptidase MepM/ murein hydrolase activator NlpD|nr:M23 family metallopeptidase [Tissierellia bacterium]MDD3227414.1 M23 family metallopeptidase [Tissierellia bacterium]MDD3751367.1 M23 family metallopeptidase [Tissierellia bacterium]MDD4046518.1 M23 family metallopeptidase [Tissierellia bacterium]MDD4678463.1 M23 family metallopeptidase [Tissierellia bacterium]